MSSQRGSLLHNRYELLDLIATGGMGEVWRALDRRLNRDVAVKLLKPELAGQKGFLDRFRIEARNSALLTHPNVCAVFDYGETEVDPDGSTPTTAYLVMELVPGEPLSSIISRESPLAPDRVLDYMCQAASGLGAAHAAGVVHRDVKPGNLLVTPEGVLKITDFGVARASGQSNLTATGQVMGTAQYLAPEQALGERVTPAADVYALGVVGYQMLTGAVPFVRESQVATALAQVNDTPPPLPESVPGPVRDLIMGLLRKEPAERPANGRDLAAAVMAVESGYQPHLPPATTPITTQTAPTTMLRRGASRPAPARTTAQSRTVTAARPPKRSGARLPLIFLVGLLALLGAWAAYNALVNGSSTPAPSNVTITKTDRSTITRTITQSETSSTSSSSWSSSSTSLSPTQSWSQVPSETLAPTSTPAPTMTQTQTQSAPTSPPVSVPTDAASTTAASNGQRATPLEPVGTSTTTTTSGVSSVPPVMGGTVVAGGSQ